MTDIAIIGLACRVPGARNYDDFWRNLRDGVESISHFRADELDLRDAPAQCADPAYVRARSILEDVDLFDAALFGIYPNEARVIDPQHRVFLECCWQALEDAGYDPTSDPSTTAVFAGASANTYFLRHICQTRDFLRDYTEAYQVGFYPTLLGTNADMLATRVSYKLNLKGPSFTVQCGCSTALVAVCQAVKSLLMYECDLALAGGVSITFPQRRGYLYQPGGMVSPDGHCRAFDADAQGTVFGDGAGVVALKRLDEALADGDHIYAVLKGAALNNDGSLKVGFTAPSVEGQARVIAMAHASAGVDPASISYVEAHGTGTPLGDPIEFAALTQAFRAATDHTGYCALGTAKTNIGHLDVASGVIGLIKTVLSLTHRQIPPLLHFRAPNPHIDLEHSPFYITAALRAWESSDGGPLRAGVSAFGVGGTNAHVVLEEAPRAVSTRSERTCQVLTLSARSVGAVERAKTALAERLERCPGESLADVAYTLSTGRHGFEHRWSAVCRDVPEAIQALKKAPAGPPPAARRETPQVCFLFPGQGAQHVFMGRDLFETEPVFRAQLQRCAELLRPHLGLDLLRVLYPDPSSADAAPDALNQTALAQPAIFAVTYAMARLWASWGVQPQAMVGHSIGEFVAACLAGVLSLEEALDLVAARGKMMNELPGGAMLSVRLPEDELRPYLNDDVSLAASNGPALSVVAGPYGAIDELAQLLDARRVPHRRLHTSHAFHSPMMEPIVGAFAARVRAVTLHPPRIPFVSCVTGDWITDEQATDPIYWASHLRQPVRFSQAVQVVRNAPEMILVESGPGTTLQTLARQHPTPGEAGQLVLSSLAAVGSRQGAAAAAYEALGRLWEAGVDVSWAAFYAGETRRRVPLPTYPFERKRYWVEPERRQEPVATRLVDASAVVDTVAVPAQGPRENEPYTEDYDMPTNQAAASDRTGRIMSKLVQVFQDLSGLEAEDIDPSASFLELGFDSLFLTQVAQEIHTAFDVTVSFRQLLLDTPSLLALAGYLDQQAPPSAFRDEAPPSADSGPAAPPPTTELASLPALMPARLVQNQGALFDVAPPGTAGSLPPRVGGLYAGGPRGYASLQSNLSEKTLTTDDYDTPGQPDGATALERIFQQQLRTMAGVMAQQLQVLGAASGVALPRALPVPAPPTAQRSDAAPSTKAEPTAPRATPRGDRIDPPGEAEFKPFGPYKPIQKGATGELTPRQEAFLGALIERYTRKTARSKQLTQEYRPYLADPRAAAGFRAQWKEMVYPIVTNRSKGSKLWDVDGNEYIDLVNGFGPIGLGHRPDFVTKAIRAQLDEGIEIGPQTPLAGDVAKLICKLTGVERVTFCNTGSEAVMAALRVARTVTGRKKVVFFSGAYHGTFDEVLVKRIGKADAARTSPIAPGIPQDNVQNIVVLDYGAPESLEWVRAHARELAAVLVEPVQSRHPALQPRAFLHEMRRITAEAGCALIIDEIVTGFRVHPGGIQALFDVRADLVTYGKVLGGGMPIGVLAGKAAFMDALDGGMWQYGDDSYPEVGVTFFAGTFVRHPLALAAAKAVLEHLDEQGPALQERVAARTATLVARLNDLFDRYSMPTRIETFSSVFYFTFPSDVRFGSILYYLLREKGIHIQEGFPCFLSTAHSEEDVERVYAAFAASVAEMRDGELLPPPPGSRATPAEARPPSAISAEAAREASPTEPQVEIWVSAQLSPDASCAYNEAFTVSLTGALNEPALRAAIQAIVSRHDALRATFDPDGGTVRFKPRLEIDIPLVDLASADAPDDALRDLIRENARTPFDLVQGPLVRVMLARLAPQRHTLLFTSHHIICDGWSTNVIIEELGALYSAYCRHETADLPAPASFRAYAETQHAESASTSAKASAVEQYWLARFAESAPALDLPTDRPRPAVKSWRGATVRRTIEPELQQALKRAAAQQGCTLFATLLAGFEALLCRLSGQQDVVVGIPVAAQALLEGPALVGHCVNFLALRGRFTEGATAADFLTETQKTLLDAYEHQSYTYGTLVRRLGARRDPSRQPLIEAQFNLEKIGANARFEGLDVAFAPCPKEFVTFDLSLNIVETPTGLVVDCDYNADLFDEETIERWLGHYRTLLAGVVADPTQRLVVLPLLSEAERRQMLVAWNDTRQALPDDRCIHDLIAVQAARTPDAVAVVAPDGRLTYRELEQRANKLAHYLRRRGVGLETLVGLCLDRSTDMVVGLLGVLKAGGAYVPLDPAYPAERLAYMLRDTRAPVLLTRQRLFARLSAHETQVVCLDTDWARIAEESAEAPVGGATPENLAYVIYTSGSTGRPKGAMIVHRGLTNYLSWAVRAYPVAEGQGAPVHSSLSFDLTITALFAPLLTGRAAHLLPERPGVETLTEALRGASDYSLVKLTPAHLELLGQQLEPARAAGRTRSFIIGGENLRAESIAFWRDAAPETMLVNEYGPTETVVGCCVYTVSADTPRSGALPIGQPIANTRLYILDRCQQPAPVGVLGELHVGGVGVARGYLNRPDLTAEKFIPDPFSDEPGARLYRTGDLARYLPDGHIMLVGRGDDQVKIRGYRIELGEIEAVLGQHPAVREVAVLAREDAPGDKRLVAYVALDATREAQEQPVSESSALRRFLEALLPDYMIPSSFVCLDALPLTPNGKIDRQALPAPGRPGHGVDEDEGYLAPRTAVETQLAGIWAELLGIQPIGVRDDFFDLGGHSLLAVRLMARIQKAFGQNLPLSMFLQGATIERLADKLGQSQPAAPWPSLTPIQPQGSKPPFFCVHGIFGDVLFYADLARYLGADQPVYGLQARGLDGVTEPVTRIESMATHYIEELRAFQPRGPYYLGGYSSGASVALEMARQLRAKGQEVALLVIFDHSNPRSDYDTAMWSPTYGAKCATNIFVNMGYWSDTFLRGGLKGQRLLIRHRARSALRALNAKATGRNSQRRPAPPDYLASLKDTPGLDYISEWPWHRVRVVEAQHQAMLDYVPDTYPGRITLFRARRQPLFCAHDPAMGWDGVAGGGVEINVVPGSHHSMLHDPYVHVLARQLSTCLDRARRASDRGGFLQRASA